MALFKSSLEEFAHKHKKDIRQDPVFRAQFQTMCANIGVDPLASNKVSGALHAATQRITAVALAATAMHAAHPFA